jgi:uncharacterized membrane protein
MTERTLRLVTAILAVAGAAITTYLLVARLTHSALVCTTGGCETVQSSRYAELFGIPVAALGLVLFLALLGVAVARGEWARLIGATLALSAFVFSTYLFVVQVAAIGAVCQWCVATDVVTTAIAALLLLRLRCVDVVPVASALPARPYPQRRANGSKGSKRPARRPVRRR